MLRTVCLLLLTLVAVSAAEKEREFDFTALREGETPSGFRSTQTGPGPAPAWKIVTGSVPPLLPPVTAKAPADYKRPVLAQTSTDREENRAPLMIFDPEVFGDFTFSTRLKIVSGEVEQMAGVAFRFVDEKNYYYVRLNAKNHNAAFFRYVNGELIGPISVAADVKTGEWNTLAVQCRGSKFRAMLNDKEIIPWTEPSYVPMPDGTTKGVFPAGKIGFWTKADTIAQFTEARIQYMPREPFAQTLVAETMKLNPRLLGLKVFAIKEGEKTPKMIASDKAEEIGQAGDTVEINCIDHGGVYTGKGKELALVTVPLHDRNGEIVGAVRVVMTTFLGQMEKNMLARATPIVKSMEARISSAQELFE